MAHRGSKEPSLGSCMSRGRIAVRRRTVVIVSIAAIFVTIPAIVYAGHIFNDVPSSNTFHNDIDWLASEGITRGCNPPANTEFCPNEAVTRGQMAAFMKRFHDRFIGFGTQAIGVGNAFREQSDTPSTGNGVVDGLALDLNIPESGFLVVHASADMEATASDAFACGINAGSSPSLALSDSWRAIDLTADFYDTCSTDTSFTVSPGTQLVRLVISGADSSTAVYGGNITAVLYTNSGAFGLLEAEPREEEARPLSD